MNKKEIEQKVREIVAYQFGASLDDITMDTKFLDDLQSDSLDAVETVMMVEDRFDLTIPDEDADAMLTVQSVADYVERKLAENEGS